MRNVPHGEVQEFNYYSESIDRDRNGFVYLSPGYSEDAERYPVLYLLHGAGGNERTWIDRQFANVILDNLIADGRVEPFVVVMPYGYTTRIEGFPRGAGGFKPHLDEFAVDFVNDLVPFIETRYHVGADRDHRAISGLSMGGAQSLSIGLSHPEIFRSIAAPTMDSSMRIVLSRRY